MTKRKGFSAEFKREAVRLLETAQKPLSCPSRFGTRDKRE